MKMVDGLEGSLGAAINWCTAQGGRLQSSGARHAPTAADVSLSLVAFNQRFEDHRPYKIGQVVEMLKRFAQAT